MFGIKEASDKIKSTINPMKNVLIVLIIFLIFSNVIAWILVSDALELSEKNTSLIVNECKENNTTFNKGVTEIVDVLNQIVVLLSDGNSNLDKQND